MPGALEPPGGAEPSRAGTAHGGGHPDRGLRPGRPWLAFRRARHALWGALAVLVVLGVWLHDRMAGSLAARLGWMSGVALLVAYPLGYLLGFKCPRCGEAYLATGGLRDFLGLGRILWASRCGRCSLPVGHRSAATGEETPVPSELPDSGPAS